MGLPIVVVPHPVGNCDEVLVQNRGREIAAECARILTAPVDQLTKECESRVFPLTTSLMPR